MRVVNRADLENAVHNSLLFSNQKSWTKGKVYVVGNGPDLTFWSTDNFIVNRSLVPGLGGPGTNWQTTATKKDLQWIKGWLTQLPEEHTTVSLRVDGSQLRVWSHVDEDINECVTPVSRPDPDWGQVTEILDGTSAASGEFIPFALAPDRFRKFSLLHADEEFPVDFQVRKSGAIGYVVQYQYGPYVSGLIVPLEREAVKYAVSTAVAPSV